MPTNAIDHSKRNIVLSRAAVLAANATSVASIARRDCPCRNVAIRWKAPLRIRLFYANCTNGGIIRPLLRNVPPTCLHDSTDYNNRYPDNRLAVTTLRTPDARSAQSNIVIVRFQSYAPTLRCRCVVTTRLHPFGKGNDFLPVPQGQRTLLQGDNKK